MEDQRNWTDASFKTYVRPLALPWLRCPGTPSWRSKSHCRCASPVRDAPDGRPTLRLDLGASAGALPAVGVGLCRAELATASTHMAELTPLRAT